MKPVPATASPTVPAPPPRQPVGLAERADVPGASPEDEAVAYSGGMVRFWLAALLVVSLLNGLVYGAMQQVLRLGANDPQIQLAEDTAAQLAAGGAPSEVLPTRTVDIGESLAPYIMVYTEQGQPSAHPPLYMASSPNSPAASSTTCAAGARSVSPGSPTPECAALLSSCPFQAQSAGFVLAGRSLREVERRAEELLWEVAAAWGVMMLVVSAPFLWHYRAFILQDRRRSGRAR